ncbi:quercetin 2,3-dioxygenase [Alkalicoccus halolimnae]|uniref:Quercetin 2,3-dioxygenase n=1 Tax=Alkalicoccus halolimnae TaxID=1667239 RepID=A0AAJ8LVM3_9BACI|nr:quercetin 2,3-dioxygenase [Alkalicoccus halolimnae]
MLEKLNHAFALASGEGKKYWFLGSLMEVKVTGEETGGAFSLLEEIDPPDFVTPLHIHRNEDEYFYVLEGEATFTIGEKTILGKPGTFVSAPRDIAHMYKIEKSGPAKIITMLVPAGLEQLFIDCSVPASDYKLPSEDVETDLEKLFGLALEYGIEVLE